MSLNFLGIDSKSETKFNWIDRTLSREKETNAIIQMALQKDSMKVKPNKKTSIAIKATKLSFSATCWNWLSQWKDEQQTMRVDFMSFWWRMTREIVILLREFEYWIAFWWLKVFYESDYASDWQSWHFWWRGGGYGWKF